MFQLLKIVKRILSKSVRPVKQSRVSINRIKELKQLKKLANSFLKFYLERKNHGENNWERDLSTRNVILLKSSIAKINKLQHDHEVKKYLKAYNYIPPKPINVPKENENAELNRLAENFIGRIETMKVNLSVSTLSHLCDYFEISLADFFKEIEKSNSSRKK